MNVLLLIPNVSSVRVEKLVTEDGRPVDYIESFTAHLPDPSLTESAAVGPDGSEFCPGQIVFFVPRDGIGLSGPVLLDDDVLAALRESAWKTPFHTSALVETANAMAARYPDVPRVLISGSAFFSSLPEHERVPALAAPAAGTEQPARSGFHGVFHRAAWQKAVDNAREYGTEPPRRVLSVCLDGRSEAAAILDGRPVFVTGGATPLEGLPGDTASGELDPGIVLYLADSAGLGPEEIAHILTRESGLSGIAGRLVTLSQVARSDDPDSRRAWDVFGYRLTLTLGQALAALGGLDAIVFSGRYHEAGDSLREYFAHLLAELPDPIEPARLRLRASLEELLVGEAHAVPQSVEA